MRKAVSAACAAVLVGGCATQPSTEPGKGSGAAYAPMVDMAGVEADAYAADVETCRATALKIRVRPIKADNDLADAVVMGVAIIVPFGMLAVSAISGISAAVNEELNPGGKPADPGMQQTALVNCMARKGYKNLDPNVTVTYVAAAGVGTRPAPRRTGLDTYVAEKFAKENSCSTTPRAVLEDKGPGFERYRVACASGQPMVLRCEFGNCTQLLVSDN